MNHSDRFADASPPEILAAYADDELDAAGRQRVDEWLAAHPEAAELLANQRQFSRQHGRLWQWTSAAEPSEATWARLLIRLRLAITAPRPAVASVQTSRRRLIVALFTVAAAILLVVVLFPSNPIQNPAPLSGGADELAVANADDVEIVRILEADIDRIVIGELPLRRAIVLAAVEDVEGLRVVKDTDGMMPTVAMQSGPNAPMIVAPMAGK